MKRKLRTNAALAAMAGALALLAPKIHAGVSYTIDFQGPIIGFPDGFGAPVLISEGDLLFSFAPAPFAPIPAGIGTAGPFNGILPDLGLPALGGPPAPGIPSGVEVDAFSYGIDLRLSTTPAFPELLSFSVDEFAVGIPALPVPPNVASEGAAGFGEAAADVFVYFPPAPIGPFLPAPPFAFPPGNTQLYDGDGFAPPAGVAIPLPGGPIPHGLGLLEPNPPTPGVPDPGSNLDGLDVDTPGPGFFPVYFSLDAGFPDPFEGPPVNSGSAAPLGFSGGDVLISMGPGGPIALYAKATLLGLDLLGVDTDDLDALILAENGVPGYQPSLTPAPPFDWGTGGTDMLLFSVRRGSAVIGALDSCLLLAIEEGDILAPPPGGAGAAPCIVIAAENLGLATARGGFAPIGDDLDALDLTPDCDGNSIPDDLDFSSGILIDSDGDGIADPCDVCPGSDDRADADLDTVPDGCDVCPGFDDRLDSDGDGAPDGCDICPGFPDNVDSDGDGVPNGCDVCPGFDDNLDADGDGVPNGCDRCPGFDDNLDADSDGVPDGCDICPGFNDNQDSDGDGVPNGCDLCPGFPDNVDSDGDGVPDGCDACPGFDDNLDGDGDGVPDGCDICPGADDNLDSDGDGVPDGCDICPGFPDNVDSDGDGVPNGCDVCPGFDDNLDADGDGVPNGCDRCPGFDDNLDADSDGVPDGCDICPGFNDNQDSDGDGVPNGCDLCPGFPDNVDSDGDGVPDGCDACPGFDDNLDGDGDGVPDGCDICPGADDNLDSDGDGVPDGCDICPGFPDNVDSDGDGVPNGCDVCPGFDDSLDADGDGVPNGCDRCPGFDDNLDADGDGVPDGCDICPGFNDNLDSDGDGVPDGCDLCPGFPDNADSDGDGVPDGCDACPGFDDNLDGDGDGVPDGCDACPGSDDRLDCDGNGVPDGCEPDLNGNGIPDPCELFAPAFSIDFQSVSKGTPDVTGLLMTEGDILVPTLGVPLPGPLPAPTIIVTAGPPSGKPDLGLPAYPGALGIPGGFPGLVEVDALSFGTDAEVDPAIWPEFRWTFSVDEHAAGLPGIIPDVNSEGALGNVEASADVFVDFPPGVMPIPPVTVGCPIPPPPLTNTHLFDGNGLPAPFVPVIPPLVAGPVPHGLGLLEANPPTPGTTIDPGDNLDAMDVDFAGAVYPAYFSVDTVFVDPIEGPPANSATDTTIGFTGADVLVTTAPAAPPIVFAPAAMLGLDIAGGPLTDDLDALILHENGSGIFDPSSSFFDWVGGATDMLLFSVRRGSMVIGMPDSLSGCPIEEGDILTTPVAGGVSPFPAIFIPAETLGLLTVRSAGPLPVPLFLPAGEELDALDVSPDCNMNGVPDRFDILYGTDPDLNGDGIPDSCGGGCVIANPAAPEPSPVKKNRYISFIPTNAGQQTAIRVELVTLDGFGAFNGQVRWVGPPQAYPEENSAFPGLTFQGAALTCTPHYMDWGAVGLMHVFSGDVIPNSVYRVQVITQGCNESDAAAYSTPLPITTGVWGDIIALFAGGGVPQPDFNDIASVVAKFLASPTAPIKAQAQLQPNTPKPSQPIDFKDVAADVSAFLGTPYGTLYSGPCACPSTVTCLATACVSDLACGSGLCFGGWCMDACGRCTP